MSKICIFGGSFNPVSVAHRRLGEQLIEYEYVDFVWYLPCYKSLHNKSLESGSDRISMLQIMCDISKYPKQMNPCTWEIDNNASGKTIDIIQQMLEEYSDYNDTFYFNIGMDNALSIQNFVDYDKVIESAPFIVMGRNGYRPSDDEWFMKEPHQYAKEVGVPETVSSTLIRNELKGMKKNGLSANFFDWIDMEVFRYIITNNLYMV